MTNPIADYAIIGDCRSAALVSRAGSIDWLCWPRFESDAIFGALLDDARGGAWSIAPRGLPSSSRRYVDDTAVLETTFADGTTEITLTDAMPITDGDGRSLTPEHEILRVVECRRGSATVDVAFTPRPRFGRQKCVIRQRGKLGARIEAREGLLTLATDGPPPVAADDSLRWTLRLEAGDSVRFSLTWTVDAPAVLSPLGEVARASLEQTLRLWRAWSKRTKFEGAHRSAVVRSAITVRLLSYAPSGAIIAAPTTSLPEVFAGSHNWDYRYCWLRDAALTVNGLLALGHADEARGFTDWLLHATRLTQPRLEVLYDVFGRPPQDERELSELAGYGGAKPVRVGNGADGQLQLDSYGEVIDAVWRTVRAGEPLDRATSRTLEGFGRYVCEHWERPDAGIWEPRGPLQRHTHSAALSWAALDRLLDLQLRGEMRTQYRDRFFEQRKRIASVLAERGYNEAIGSYTAELDGNTLDASALLVGWYGYDEPSSPRMRSTFARVVAELSPGPGLLYRYRAPKPSEPEGAFGACCFWLSEHLAAGGGSLEDARATFDHTFEHANDLGLMAEEIDPKTGAALGNFPQTFTHVALLNAAIAIAKREARDA